MTPLVPMVSKKRNGNAIANAGVFDSRHGPCADLPVFHASRIDTPACAVPGSRLVPIVSRDTDDEMVEVTFDAVEIRMDPARAA